MSVLYGINPVLEALKGDANRVERVCIETGRRAPRVQEILELARRNHIPFSLEQRAWLDRKAAGQRHQGVLCYVAESPAVTEEEILGKASSPGLLVVLDGVEDPHNLGAILRSAEVAGVDGVFLPLRRSAGLTATAAKASAGAAAHVKVARHSNTPSLLDRLKAHGYWVAGLDAAGPQALWEVDLNVPTVIVLGSEGAGLHRLVKEKCDFLVRIPVRGKITSLNVSVAAGIALYEAIRQRHSAR